MTPKTSLFDASAPSPTNEAASWVSTILAGEMVIVLCTVAVALFSFQLLLGRIQMARGLRTVVGIFLLLGAPTIAAGMMAWQADNGGPKPLILDPQRVDQTRGDIPEADFDPYAGASLRRN